VAERIKTGAGNDTEPAYPFLFEAPKESPRFSNPRVPEVRLGQTLSCGTQSIWRPDLPESFVFRAPQSFGYQWTKGGVAIPGATGLKLTPTVGGDYACNLLATNAAGTAEGVGITWRVRRYEGPPGSPLLRILKVRHSLKGGTAQILVKVADPGTLTLEGRKVKLRTISCPGAEVVKVRVQAKGGALNKLKRTGKVKVPIKLRLRIEGSEASIPLVITLRMRTRG
jgi:hypothetical protein